MYQGKFRANQADFKQIRHQFKNPLNREVNIFKNMLNLLDGIQFEFEFNSEGHDLISSKFAFFFIYLMLFEKIIITPPPPPPPPDEDFSLSRNVGVFKHFGIHGYIKRYMLPHIAAVHKRFNLSNFPAVFILTLATHLFCNR